MSHIMHLTELGQDDENKLSQIPDSPVSTFSKRRKNRKRSKGKGKGSLFHYTEDDGGRGSVVKPGSMFLEQPGEDTLIWNSKIYKVTFSTTELFVRTRPRKNQAQKTVLHGINAIFKPGTVTALMGPSGAGKTSLLNVLSGRTQRSLVIEAKALQLNGAKLTSAAVKLFSSLVPQDDILIAVLTPRESITYAAQLVLTSPKRERQSLINKTLKVLSLTHCADTICGDADTKGISGGERKRTSIGLELITNPSCLFLDEPTSGLDSKVALDVVSTLRDLASEGRTLVCTIHQPSYAIFQKFDRLLLLRKGRVAYQGRTSEVTNYFDSIGHPCPQFLNPADHILNVVSVDDYTEDFEKHELFEEYEAYARGVGNGDMKALKQKEQEQKSEFKKLEVLFRRASYVTFKDKKQLRTRLFQVVFVGLIAGLTFFQLEKSQFASFDRQSALLMVTVFIVLSSVTTTINAIPMEKTMLIREYANGTYNITTFWFSRTLVYFMYQVLYITIYSVIVYFLIGFDSRLDRFLTFWSALTIEGFVAISLGFAAGALFPTVQQATVLVPVIMLPLLLFSGLLISFESIPVYFLWVYYISFPQYAYRVVIVNEFEDYEFLPCEENDLGVRCPFGTCAETNTTEFVSASCPGELVLEAGDFNTISTPVLFLIITTFMMVAMAMSFLAVYNLLMPGRLPSPRTCFKALKAKLSKDRPVEA